MEIESILSNGCERCLKEFMTVKNDRNDEKRRLMSELISKGTYNLPDDLHESHSKTKTVVDSLLTFLKE